MIMVICERDWLTLLGGRNLEDLLRRYTIVLSGTWSPPQFSAVWSFAHLPSGDVYLMALTDNDREWAARLDARIRTVAMSPAHFVNPDVFAPRPISDRDIDILTVANWSKFKRHWLLFDAIRRLPANLRIVLVGYPDGGRTKDDVWREAAYFGVGGRVELREELPIHEVARLQARAKISVIFSRREGCCTAAAESLMADSPVGMVRGAHIGSAAFINAQTGCFLDQRRLSRDLAAFLERRSEYHARAWAVEHFGCVKTTERLTAILESDARRRGAAWTRGLLTPILYPTLMHANPHDAFRVADAYAELQLRHGLLLPAGQLALQQAATAG